MSISEPVALFRRDDRRIIEIAEVMGDKSPLLTSVALDSSTEYFGDDGLAQGYFNVLVTVFDPKENYLTNQLTRKDYTLLYPKK